jgi:mRNA-degrading endonuclease RelE of RelBE toxin-antitoxin system
MNWELLVTKSAKKELANLPHHDQIRIERTLDALQIDPFGGDIKRLQAACLAQAYWQLSNFL